MILEENLMMGPFNYCFKSAIYLDRKPYPSAIDLSAF
jgi:hypothetical protein